MSSKLLILHLGVVLCFFAGGWGYPQGFRVELGYNLGAFLSPGCSFGINDFWSSDTGAGTLALFGSIRFPIRGESVSPYLLFCWGNSTFENGKDKYTLIFLVLITVNPELQIRPEAGIVFTSRHGIETKNHFGINIIFELD
jgi:hypothetical protein